MRHILVAVDDSASSEHVAEFVNGFFGGLDVEVTAVNVGQAPIGWGVYPATPGALYPWPHPSGGAAFTAAATTDPATAGPDDARQAGEQTLSTSGIDGDHEIIEFGADVAETLRQLASDRGVDMLVVGSSHKGILERLMSPSVSADLAKSAPTPVLIVH